MNNAVLLVFGTVVLIIVAVIVYAIISSKKPSSTITASVAAGTGVGIDLDDIEKSAYRNLYIALSLLGFFLGCLAYVVFFPSSETLTAAEIQYNNEVHNIIKPAVVSNGVQVFMFIATIGMFFLLGSYLYAMIKTSNYNLSISDFGKIFKKDVWPALTLENEEYELFKLEKEWLIKNNKEFKLVKGQLEHKHHAEVDKYIQFVLEKKWLDDNNKKYEINRKINSLKHSFSVPKNLKVPTGYKHHVRYYTAAFALIVWSIIFPEPAFIIFNAIMMIIILPFFSKRVEDRTYQVMLGIIVALIAFNSSVYYVKRSNPIIYYAAESWVNYQGLEVASWFQRSDALARQSYGVALDKNDSLLLEAKKYRKNGYADSVRLNLGKGQEEFDAYGKSLDLTSSGSSTFTFMEAEPSLTYNYNGSDFQTSSPNSSLSSVSVVPVFFSQEGSKQIARFTLTKNQESEFIAVSSDFDVIIATTSGGFIVDNEKGRYSCMTGPDVIALPKDLSPGFKLIPDQRLSQVQFTVTLMPKTGISRQQQSTPTPKPRSPQNQAPGVIRDTV